MRARHRLIPGLASVAAVVGAVAISGASSAADVTGEIYALHRYAAKPFPDERARIRLGGNGQRFEGHSGSGGSFYLYDVPPGTYRLEVESHYGRVRRSVDIGARPRQDLGRITIKR